MSEGHPTLKNLSFHSISSYDDSKERLAKDLGGISRDGGGIAIEIETKWVLKHYSQKLKLFFFIDLTGKERILKEEK